MTSRNGEDCVAMHKAQLKAKNILPHTLERLKELRLRCRMRLRQFFGTHAHCGPGKADPIELVGVIQDGIQSSRPDISANAFDDSCRGQGFAEYGFGKLAASRRN
jgi:hypothetical protein